MSGGRAVPTPGDTAWSERGVSGWDRTLLGAHRHGGLGSDRSVLGRNRFTLNRDRRSVFRDRSVLNRDRFPLSRNRSALDGEDSRGSLDGDDRGGEDSSALDGDDRDAAVGGERGSGGVGDLPSPMYNLANLLRAVRMATEELRNNRVANGGTTRPLADPLPGSDVGGASREPTSSTSPTPPVTSSSSVSTPRVTNIPRQVTNFLRRTRGGPSHNYLSQRQSQQQEENSGGAGGTGKMWWTSLLVGVC